MAKTDIFTSDVLYSLAGSSYAVFTFEDTGSFVHRSFSCSLVGGVPSQCRPGSLATLSPTRHQFPASLTSFKASHWQRNSASMIWDTAAVVYGGADAYVGLSHRVEFDPLEILSSFDSLFRPHAPFSLCISLLTSLSRLNPTTMFHLSSLLSFPCHPFMFHSLTISFSFSVLPLFFFLLRVLSISISELKFVIQPLA